MELKDGKKGLELGIVSRESGLDHSHLNKATLDLIEQALTTALKAAYDDAVTKVHEHSNKAVLDLVEESLTSALKTAYDDAVTKAHSHANKTILDAIEQAFTTVLKNKLDGIEEAATADQTDEEIQTAAKADTDIADAISKKHDRSHSIVDSNDHSDKSDFIDATLSPTLLTGGDISEGTNAGTFKVNALTSLLRIDTTYIASLVKITLEEQDNQALTNSDVEYYVVLEYNNGSPRIQISTSRCNGQTNLCIGKVTRDSGNTVHYMNSGNRLQSGVHRLHKRASELRRSEISDGLQIADEGSQKLSISAGLIYRGINRFQWSFWDTAASPTPDTFTYVYYDFNTSSWVYVTDQTDIDVDNYNKIDTGDGLASCNRYKCDWVFLHPDMTHVFIVYGQDDNNKSIIQLSEVPEVPDLIDKFGVLIGRIIIDGGVATFDEIQSIKHVVFQPKTVTDHSNLSSLQGGAADEYYHLTADEHTNKYIQGNEIKIKLYSQDAEPTLSADEVMSIWKDTNDSNKVYLIFRRGSGDQVSVELS